MYGGGINGGGSSIFSGEDCLICLPPLPPEGPCSTEFGAPCDPLGAGYMKGSGVPLDPATWWHVHRLIWLWDLLHPDYFPGPPRLCRRGECHYPATISALEQPILTQDQINAACMMQAYSNNNGFDQNSAPTAWNANGVVFQQYTQYRRPSTINPSANNAGAANVLIAPEVFLNADYHQCGGTGYLP